MRDLAILFIHLLTTIVGLMRPGGARAVVAAIVETKRRIPRWGCRRIAQQLCLVFGEANLRILAVIERLLGETIIVGKTAAVVCISSQ